jgi:hypothetical protein
MEWQDLIYRVRVVFLLGFILFAIWLMASWMRHARENLSTIRDWIGAFAFWLGILSCSVLGYQYAYFGVTHKLVADVGTMASLVWYGLLTSIGGIPVAFAGRGWVRRAAVFILVVATFEWSHFEHASRRDYVVTEAMFATLAFGALLWFAIHKIRTGAGSIKGDVK